MNAILYLILVFLAYIGCQLLNVEMPISRDMLINLSKYMVIGLLSLDALNIIFSEVRKIMTTGKINVKP